MVVCETSSNATGCSSTVGSSQPGTADARPIEFHGLPEPKDGSGTSPGCYGVQARGECQGDAAVYCDLSAGHLRKIDCGALLPQQSCVIDLGRGAICTTLEADPNLGGGIAACPLTQTTEEGYCTKDHSAIFCDTSGAQPVTLKWPCPAAGLTCSEGRCVGGQPAQDCGALDFAGVCDGAIARWCDPFSGLQERDCGAMGNQCEVNTCASGAYCCGEPTIGDAQQCAQLGIEGQCTGTDVSYCLFDEIQHTICEDNFPCQVDVCGPGAFCCNDPAVPPNECLTIGPEGVCANDQTVRFCTGTSNEDIIEFTCDPGETCGFNTCFEGFADCCD